MNREKLLLKARLLVDGIRIDESAYDQVGTRFKEQVHHLFEYDFNLHQERLCPAELRLPGNTVVQVRLNERSPYLVSRKGDTLLLEEFGKTISEIEWLERPEFYDMKTTAGTPMTSVGELVGTDCIAVCHTNACMLFADGSECAFCNLNYTPKQYDEVVIKKKANEVAETFAAAFKTGAARHFEITGGILPGDREIRILEQYLTAIREATGMTDLPGTAIMTPPDNLQDLERLQRLGLRGVGFNLECFNPAYFRAVCPGKEKRIGYQRYRDAQRAAVEIFGAGGRVYSGFVAGVEPMKDLLAGIQELAEEGIASIPLVWSPSTGTRFHGHRPPTAEWYVELAERASGIMIRHLKRDRTQPAPVPTRCTGCQTQCLLHDSVNVRAGMLKALSGAI